MENVGHAPYPPSTDREESFLNLNWGLTHEAIRASHPALTDWHWLVATVDGAARRFELFVDGVEVAGGVTGGVLTSGALLTFGANPGGSLETGAMDLDEVVLLNCALEGAEILRWVRCGPCGC